jgi:Ca-activated chloride channel family protein
VALVAALGGCSKAPESGGKARSSEAELMLASFLEAHGQDLDSCLKGLPELVGAGGDPSFAGRQPLAQRADRVMLALDASGSMAGRVGGETKMEAAKRAASAFLKGIPDGVAVGLVAFGHRGDNSETGKAESCRGVETIYRIGAADPAGLSRALGSFEARGWTPLADALTAASRSFAPSDKVGAQVVYVVSDGEETCGGDPVAAARALHGGPVKAVVNIIGFDLAPADRAQLREVAEAGGGQLLEARSPSELQRLMEETRHQIVNLHAITGERLQSGIARPATILRSATP